MRGDKVATLVLIGVGIFGASYVLEQRVGPTPCTDDTCAVAVQTDGGPSATILALYAHPEEARLRLSGCLHTVCNTEDGKAVCGCMQWPDGHPNAAAIRNARRMHENNAFVFDIYREHATCEFVGEALRTHMLVQTPSQVSPATYAALQLECGIPEALVSVTNPPTDRIEACVIHRVNAILHARAYRSLIEEPGTQRNAFDALTHVLFLERTRPFAELKQLIVDVLVESGDSGILALQKSCGILGEDAIKARPFGMLTMGCAQDLAAELVQPPCATLTGGQIACDHPRATH